MNIEAQGELLTQRTPEIPRNNELIIESTRLLKNDGHHIIDAHSHLGRDSWYKLRGDINEYIRIAAEMGITEALLMPPPCPQYYQNGRKILPLKWDLINGEREYYKTTFYKSRVVKKPLTIPSTPYKTINEKVRKQVENNKSKIKLHFIPLVNPIVDDLDYVEELLQSKPVALKTHGIAGGVDPKEIGTDFFRLIRLYDTPLIIHTDCDNRANITELENIFNLNSPLEWINILSRHGVNAMLTHGVRLNKESLEIIRKSDQFVIGIAPDILMNIEKNRLYSNNNYLETLLDLSDSSKIVFDIDYPWNIESKESYNLDTQSLSRIKNLIEDPNIYRKIVFDNAFRFFKLQNR